MICYDCHAHVYERVTAVAGARYAPEQPAPLDRWLQHLQQSGIEGGVLVQVSFLGTDNSELCAALARLDASRFAGVAVVEPSIAEPDIDRLRASGVRGFRWNLVRGAPLPDLSDRCVSAFLERVRTRGMHIEVHLESPRLAGFIGPLLKQAGTVVVDHLGLPCEPNPDNEPWLQAIDDCSDLSGLYVKLSAPYRTPFDTRPHARALFSRLLPGRLVWGSDWPHTQHEDAVSYTHVADLRSELPIRSDARAVDSLYGLGRGNRE